MKIFLAADHRGLSLKEHVRNYLVGKGHQVEDCGAPSLVPDDDYVDYGVRAVEGLREGERAILICGSGHGMDITANRYLHIRAILGFNADVVRQGREHEDANVLAIPSDWTTENEVEQLVDVFLNTKLSNDARHVRRRAKLRTLRP